MLYFFKVNMDKELPLGVKIFATIYFLIGLICIYLSLIPIVWHLKGSPMLEWITTSLYSGIYVSKFDFIFLNFFIYGIFATIFIISAILLFKRDALGYWLPFPFLVIIVFFMVVFLPLAIAHIVFFNISRIKNKFVSKRMDKKRYCICAGTVSGFILFVVLYGLFITPKKMPVYERERYRREFNKILIEGFKGTGSEIESKIILVNYHNTFAIVDAGKNVGVNFNSKLRVVRDNSTIANLSVLEVRDKICAVESNPLQEIYKVREGDRVLIVNP